MRLFIAVDIPQNFNSYLKSIQKNFGMEKGIKLTNQFHITLKFLGEISPEYIKENLKQIKFKPFKLTLDNVGFFPSENYIKVVWLGVKNNPYILSLQKKVDEITNNIKSDHEFHPHITLARVKFISDREKFIKDISEIKIKNYEFEVDKFTLYKSDLTREGPVHTPLQTYTK